MTNSTDEIDKILRPLKSLRGTTTEESSQLQRRCFSEAKRQIQALLTEARIEELKAPNDLLRSMYQIACREYALGGENTNWQSFIDKLAKELEREHRIMYPDQYHQKKEEEV